MKKAYCKPRLFYERFELSQHIASCELQLNYNLGSGCTASGVLWGIPIENGFLDSDAACAVKYEGYCYTNSAAITLTYTS